ncbi:hypothetical protein ACP70R_017276 [Stipagrostis hirtigluma subsp. patula]
MPSSKFTELVEHAKSKTRILVRATVTVLYAKGFLVDTAPVAVLYAKGFPVDTAPTAGQSNLPQRGVWGLLDKALYST